MPDIGNFAVRAEGFQLLGVDASPPKNAAEKAEFSAALKVSAATMPGISAWGLVSGMAMVKSGLTLWQALGMSFFVFAGSAQLATLPLMIPWSIQSETETGSREAVAPSERHALTDEVSMRRIKHDTSV